MSPGQPSDEDRIEAYYACSHAALDQLYRKYYRQLVAFFRRCGLQQADADDLADEVFLRIARSKWTGRGRYDRSLGQFVRWLWAIARNLLAECWRKQGRRPKQDLIAPENLEVQIRIEDEPLEPLTAEDLPGLGQFAGDVQDCIRRLPDRLQDVFLLDSIGWPLQQIADSLGIPYGTAGNRLFQARQQLRQCLQRRGYLFVPQNNPLPPGAVIVARFEKPSELLLFVPNQSPEA